MLRSRKLFEELNGLSHSNILLSQNTNLNNVSQSHANDLIRYELYVILEAVVDHVEMLHNIGKQSDNWNNLFLNSINMITLAASTMAGVAGFSAPLLAFRVSSGLLFSSAMGMLVIMNKIQPLQMAEEQRNATTLFRKLQNENETKLAIGKVTEGDIKNTIAKVLALDKAYPPPLLRAMIEKFPKKF